MKNYIKDSFAFFKADTKWLQKLAIGGGIFAISAFFSFISEISKHPLLSIIAYSSLFLIFAAEGYIIQFLHNQINNKNEILPGWKNNFKKYMKLGLFSFFVGILVLILFFPFFIPFAIIVTDLFIENIALGQLLIQIPSLLLLTSIYMLFIAIYAKNFKITDCLKLKKIVKYVFKNFLDFWLIAITTGIGLAFCISLLSVIGFYTKNAFLCLIMNFLFFIALISLHNFYAQFLKRHNYD